MVVEPACPQCGVKQPVTVPVTASSEVDSTSIENSANSTVIETTTTANVYEGKTTMTNQSSSMIVQKGVTLPEGPIPSYFSSDAGAIIVTCTNTGCGSTFQVYGNVTLSVSVLG